MSVPEGHPEPLTRARPATAEEVPATCRRLALLATERGWAHAITYAHGTTLDAQGRPGRLVESVLLRLAHPCGRRAGAEWIDRKFSTAWTWVPGLVLGKARARDLRAWIEGAPQAPDEGDEAAMRKRREVPGQLGLFGPSDDVEMRGAEGKRRAATKKRREMPGQLSLFEQADSAGAAPEELHDTEGDAP